MKCANCGGELKENQKFCPNCGFKVVKACAYCGEILKEEQRFCPNCGQPSTIDVGNNQQLENLQLRPNENGITNVRSEDDFQKELKEVAAKDGNTLAAIKFYGTKVFLKELFPLLKNNEKIVSIIMIHKLNIDKYSKEFLAVTTNRVFIICKGGAAIGLITHAKVSQCNIEDIIDIETEKALIGDKISIKTQAQIMKATLVGKGSSEDMKQVILALRSR